MRAFSRPRRLRQAEGDHSALNARCPRPRGRTSSAWQALPALRLVGELLPALVPAALVGGQVRDHRAQRRAERAERRPRPSRRRARATPRRSPRRSPRSSGPTSRRAPAVRIAYSMILLVRLEGCRGRRAPCDLTAILTSSRSETPIERCCLPGSSDPRRASPAAARGRRLRNRSRGAPRLGPAAHLVEGDVDRGDRDVGQVHRDLRDPVLLDEPADRLDGPSASPGSQTGLPLLVLHDRARERVALALRRGRFSRTSNAIAFARRVEVVFRFDVVGDEEVARADRGRARSARLKAAGPEVGLPRRVGEACPRGPRTRPRARRRGSCARDASPRSRSRRP